MSGLLLTRLPIKLSHLDFGRTIWPYHLRTAGCTLKLSPNFEVASCRLHLLSPNAHIYTQ
jgi:hypothetical protein